MGMYTEFHFNAELKKDVPTNVLWILKSMISPSVGVSMGVIPADLLFSCDRWMSMLYTDSAYFAADTYSTLRFDEFDECWYLCIRCNLKNHQHEIEKFVAWVSQYVYAEEGDFLGFLRHEEVEMPTLIFYPRVLFTPSERPTHNTSVLALDPPDRT
jgi:hypothetical protein